MGGKINQQFGIYFAGQQNGRPVECLPTLGSCVKHRTGNTVFSSHSGDGVRKQPGPATELLTALAGVELLTSRLEGRSVIHCSSFHEADQSAKSTTLFELISLFHIK